MRAGRADVAGREVDQLAGEPVADRAPEVLLDQAVGLMHERLPFVDRTSDAGRQRVAERRQRARLVKVWLGVADANLDRRKGEVRANAPPDLSVLGDRARVVEE